jgi:glucose/mannose transport system substrate-binding protein
MFPRKPVWGLASTLILVGLVFAACGTPATPRVEPSTNAPPAAKTSSAPRKKIEVFSWWVGGGEAAGLEAMIKIFKTEYPDIDFVNAAVAGGAGTNARAVLASRLQAGDPPDSWQGHAGQELIGTYVKAHQLESLNFLYAQENWLDVMPKTLIPLISQDGQIYSVPVNIHRANVLWYNPRILAKYNLPVPATLDEFIADLEKLNSAGVIPLALGEQWTVMHLFETILLSTLGPDQYGGLWTGKTDWNGPEVHKALENFERVLRYTNSDASTLSWQDAAQLVVNGDAAFNIMGDWNEAYFKELGKIPKVDYGWTPVPGTAGVFQFLSDSFVLPVGAPNREGTIDWLKLAGSKEGQDAFNPVKGSIPARNDADRSLYDEYSQSAMDDWASDIVVGSLYHGVVANDSWKTEINTDLGIFLTDKNIDSLQAALVSACKSSGPCQ